ncbi:TlpA family protein disulfide reductase [Zunongwangia sp.]|uniref:TlpA family protein disulfide reductase n=1 Tax=Zunongwangia sp. TaxID=1965325 RepID=UPI003AA8FD90
MRNIFITTIIIFFFTGCKNDSGKTEPVSIKNIQPVTNTKNLTSSFMNWWTYHYNDISLESDFSALDDKFQSISKEEFLRKLTTGRYIPVEMKTDNVKTYKLYKLSSKVDKEISSTIKNFSSEIYKLYKKEGNKFPDFELTDLEGTIYNNESLVGKITIIKTWFIACKPCVQEIPELNKLVNKYKDNTNYLFLSLALDNENDLKNFLEKTEFNYKVAAEQRNLIENQLNLNAYPRHLVINQNGNIDKIFGKVSDLTDYLEKL